MNDVTVDLHDTQFSSGSFQRSTVQRLQVVIAQVATHRHTHTHARAITRDICSNVKVELKDNTRTVSVAFWDPPSGSKKVGLRDLKLCLIFC